ncbi:MAG: WbuC family cupin fold metalloprotein [Betaproteobacteria bacterium]|nr:WbuC family cupin fold metalloprotein [Betaproteobacteria bacterium]
MSTNLQWERNEGWSALNSNKFHAINPEVLYSDVAITTADRSDVDLFKQLSSHNSRKRIRLCTHDSPDDRLHEMLIVHERGAYVHPHKHPGKTESMHIIEGEADIVIFDDEGRITRIINMGDYASGRVFYYRMAVSAFHTMIIRSDVLVFHETTNGPFVRSETVFAPWAPEDGDIGRVNAFMADLDDRVSLNNAQLKR